MAKKGVVKNKVKDKNAQPCKKRLELKYKTDFTMEHFTQTGVAYAPPLPPEKRSAQVKQALL